MDNKSHSLTKQIKAEAKRLGFSACGVARADKVDESIESSFRKWIIKGKNAEMKYMENYFDLRMDPRKLHPGTKSIISVALNYYPAKRLNDDQYQFAYYAYGKDYHEVMKTKLNKLVQILPQESNSKFVPRLCVDTAPILERFWAWKAGLGWIGKNHSLIIPEQGSFFILGEILSDIELEYDTPIDSRCGDCHLCSDKCIVLCDSDGFDASRCHSFRTIELKGNISEMPCNDAKGGQIKYIYGCDCCQLVCPHNKNAVPSELEEFAPSVQFLNMSKEDWNALSRESYRELFRHSAVKRAKYEKLCSNILYARFEK